MQCGVWRNDWRTAALAIAQIAGDEQFDHATLADELHALCPAGDHATQRKFNCLASTVGAIKNLALIEPAVVVHLHGVAGLGICTRAFTQNAVLQARRCGHKCFGRVGVNFSGAGGE